ncbi:MAG: hypothetical protein LCI00_09770 [Chloroflexi bacterium]|nr:hypothetical protein [Chloroflexota bacterium]MCC6892986.1 hypothetical protein [Anaerolineae bacterium]
MTATSQPNNIWDTTEYQFPRHGILSEKLKFLVGYAVLAPSIHNSQPWKFAVRESEIRVLADRTRQLNVADTDARELYVSVGCALENLLTAATYFGLRATVTYFPDPKDEVWVATVTFAEGGVSPSLADQERFHAITLRHTNRQTYANKPLTEHDIQRLGASVREEGVALQISDDTHVKLGVNALVVSADITQFADPHYREELNQWIERGTFGHRWLISRMGQLATTYLASHHKPVKPEADIVLNAPLLALISSTTDDRLSQVKAGQVFERIALQATTLNIGVQPLSQVIQVNSLKPELLRIFGASTTYAQMVFRLGYTDIATWETSRQPVDTVVTS